MGKQFRFYLLPSDIDRIMVELQTNLAVRVIGDVSPSPCPIELESPYTRVDPQQQVWPATLANCFLTSSDSPDIRMWYMPKRQLWAIDDDRSEVIEFSGCEFSGTVLNVGRFYYRSDMLVNMSIWPKRPEFVSWAEKVFKTTKKILNYSPNLLAYIGEHAAKWKREGGVFGSI